MNCPHCGAALEGLGTFCWTCERPVRKKKETEPPERSEKEIQAAIVQYLRAVGCQVAETSQRRASTVTEGLPDLAVFADGRFTWAEIKTPSGKLRESQERFRSWCEMSGSSYEVWRSVDDAHRWIEGDEEVAA